MSVRISALKKSKKIVYEYLKEKYPNNRFSLFYSIGEKEDDYFDQHLKVETDISNGKWKELSQEVHNFLVKDDPHYNSLRIRVSNFRVSK